ncbi:MAG: hypothetical protein LUE86_05030 [Clostridiales bacterium]|nr:hypothetical protein [Clostridiales bacterium]
MLVEYRDRYRLNRDDIQNDTETGATIEAANLLYAMMDNAIAASGDSLEVKIHGRNEGIRSLYQKCCEQIEKVSQAGEKAGFLVMGILKNTFVQALPLMLVPLEDLLHGNHKTVEQAKKFLELIDNDPSLNQWKEKEIFYRKLLESIGMNVSGTDYSDLSAITDPLTNALTFYQNKRLKIYRARAGERSTERPVLMSEVCKFRSEKEFVDAIASCGNECVIAFGGIEKTNRQQKDYFDEWLRNMNGKQSRWESEDINSEAYLSDISRKSRQILLCIKAGECIYLLWMPYETESYLVEDDSSKYVYGRRAGYAPMEIFYKEPPAAETDSTFLAIPKKAWKLNELMDDMQKVWLPVFFEETCEMFFKQEPKCDPIIFPEEMKAIVRDETTDAACCSIVPIGYEKPAIYTYQYHVPEPEALFVEEPVMEKLIQYFHITGFDLSDAPILPRMSLTPEKADAMLTENVTKAYIREVSCILAKHMGQTWEMRDWIVKEILSQPEAIIAAAREGKFLTFQSDIVAGRLILDKDGNPCVHQSSRPPYKIVPDTESISSDSWRIYPERYLREFTNQEQAFFDGCPVASKPSVVILIRPKTTEDYRTLFTACGKEMPEFFKLADEIQWFCKEYRGILGYHVIDNNAWKCRERINQDNGIVSFPSFADINICTTKRIYKDNYKKERA